MPRQANSKKTAKSVRKSKIKTETWSLSLTQEEIIHIRNLLSILLPPTGEISLSESLLECNDMSGDVDSSLWQKIWNLCVESGVAIGDEAPDFLVGPTDPTPLAVYKVHLDEDEGGEE